MSENQTNYMRADEIANGFNTTEDKQYWRASIAGTRLRPEVNFNSRASMVQVTYSIHEETFTISFSKSAVAWGDYLASAYRSMHQILTSLKAAGLPFPEPMDGAELLVAYNPKTKEAIVTIGSHGDAWASVPPMPFKVLVPGEPESVPPMQIPLDDASTET